MFRRITLAVIAATGALAFAFAAQAGGASSLTVVVKDRRGIPIKDAVITVYPAKGVSAPAKFAWPNAMAQKDLNFVPGTLIVPKGSKVAFPNFDRVRHSIYSFSDAARFEISLYGRDQSRAQSFPVAGNVALGCNIHDSMRGYIKVVDTPYAAKTDREGRVVIDGLPSGATEVRIWHPAALASDNEADHDTVLADGANSRAVVLPLRR
ncbi:methylamine utilization protein [Novosphingopyxis sp.]|uniref:methylamine utilization protein n=1 Tax=Novosphingopyxis sp. TaxID=2709690 RepID=UPI003B5A5DC9